MSWAAPGGVEALVGRPQRLDEAISDRYDSSFATTLY